MFCEVCEHIIEIHTDKNKTANPQIQPADTKTDSPRQQSSFITAPDYFDYQQSSKQNQPKNLLPHRDDSRPLPKPNDPGPSLKSKDPGYHDSEKPPKEKKEVSKPMETIYSQNDSMHSEQPSNEKGGSMKPKPPKDQKPVNYPRQDHHNSRDNEVHKTASEEQQMPENSENIKQEADPADHMRASPLSGHLFNPLKESRNNNRYVKKASEEEPGQTKTQNTLPANPLDSTDLTKHSRNDHENPKVIVLEPPRSEANQTKKVNEKPVSTQNTQENKTNAIPLHKPDTKPSDPNSATEDQGKHTPKNTIDKAEQDPKNINQFEKASQSETKNHGPQTTKGPNNYQQEALKPEQKQQQVGNSDFLQTPPIKEVLITDETDSYYSPNERPDNYQSMKDINSSIPKAEDTNHTKKDTRKIIDASPFRKSQEDHDTTLKNNTTPKGMGTKFPDASSNPTSVTNKNSVKDNAPNAQASYLNFLSNNAKTYVNAKSSSIDKPPERYDLNKKLQEMKVPTQRESYHEPKTQVSTNHPGNDYKKDSMFDLNETSYKRKPSISENPLFDGGSPANSYTRRHAESMEPPKYGARRADKLNDDYFTSKIPGYREPSSHNSTRPPSAKLKTTAYRNHAGESNPIPKAERDKDYYSKQNDLNQIFQKLNEKRRTFDQPREQLEESKKDAGNVNTAFPANKRLQEEKERIEKMLSEQVQLQNCIGSFLYELICCYSIGGNKKES